jgi:hypothetical protein
LRKLVKIAVVGAGIYGSTTAILLAEHGHTVHLFDPLGTLQAASAINQGRVHSGYHYPRSRATICETLRARLEFQHTYAAAIVRDTRHYYAIPHEGSRTSPDEFEAVMEEFRMPLRRVKPAWINFDFIARCYEVDEQIFDIDTLRAIVEERIRALNIRFTPRKFHHEEQGDFKFVVWATYGLSLKEKLFLRAKYQIAEKVLIELPADLRGISLVVVDGPFTAFDPYGSSYLSQFGSAKHTNHWSAGDCGAVPASFLHLLNRPEFASVGCTKFHAMREDSALAVPASRNARYLGSRFTMRVVEDLPDEDRRTLYLMEPCRGHLHLFSGKVVGAVKAARMVLERVSLDA